MMHPTPCRQPEGLCAHTSSYQPLGVVRSIAEPTQRAQAGKKAVLAAARYDEARKPLQLAGGSAGAEYRKRAAAVAGADNRIASRRVPPKKSLSLIHSVCTNSNWRPRFAPTKANIKPRSTPSSSSYAVGQRRPVGGAAADHPMNARDSGDVRIARIRAADVRAERGLVAECDRRP